jgi:hypothetical protein
MFNVDERKIYRNKQRARMYERKSSTTAGARSLKLKRKMFTLEVVNVVTMYHRQVEDGRENNNKNCVCPRKSHASRAFDIQKLL